MNIDKWVIAYVWFLSLVGALFYGFEIARMTHDMDKEIIMLESNKQLQNCQKVIAGSLYQQ